MAFNLSYSISKLRGATLVGLLVGVAAASVPVLKAVAQGTQIVPGTMFGNTTPVSVGAVTGSTKASAGNNPQIETVTAGGTATAATGTMYIEVPTYQPYAHLGGALTSVTATFTGTNGTVGVTTSGSTISYSFKNTSGFTQNYTITGEPITLTLFRPVTTAATGSGTALPGGISTSGTATAYNPGNVANNATSTDATAEPYTFTASGTINDANLTAGGNNLAVWSGYTGVTTMYFDVFASLTDHITTTFADSVATDLSTWLLQSSVSVTYTFNNAVPEPGTWGLLASCGVAVGFSVRRHKLRRRLAK